MGPRGLRGPEGVRLGWRLRGPDSSRKPRTMSISNPRETSRRTSFPDSGKDSVLDPENSIDTNIFLEFRAKYYTRLLRTPRDLNVDRFRGSERQPRRSIARILPTAPSAGGLTPSTPGAPAPVSLPLARLPRKHLPQARPHPGASSRSRAHRPPYKLIVYGNQLATGRPPCWAGWKIHCEASARICSLKRLSRVGGSRRVESDTTRPCSFT